MTRQKNSPTVGADRASVDEMAVDHSAPIISQSCPPVTIEQMLWLADRLDPDTTDPEILAALVEVGDALELGVSQ